MNKASSSNGTGQWILLFFFLSGLSALVYEIVWMKMLVLVIGNTIYSTTTVLASFMSGLALGSYVAGRLLPRFENPLRIYGILEGVIGAYALSLPLLLAGTQPLFRLVYQNASPQSFNLLRMVVCGAILFVPTTMMGATLPLLSDYLAKGETRLGWTVGKLYGINTLGAVMGSASAGFLLIPTIGLYWTTGVAALLNLTIAAAVLSLSKKATEIQPQPSPAEPQQKKKKQKRKKQAKEDDSPKTLGWQTLVSVLIAIGLAGAASMIYQIAWTRVLSLLIGSSVYAFALIVTAFILGLALGPLLIGKFIDRRKHLIWGLAFIEITIGITALLMIPVFGRLPTYVSELLLETDYTFHQLQATEFGLIFLLVLVPTFMMGAAFPITAKICAAGTKRFGTYVGNVYAVNTLGAILGTLAGGFLLIPWLGTQNAIFVAATINLAAAVVVLLPRFSVRSVAVSLATILLAVLIWQRIPSWDSLLLTSGPYIYADRYKEQSEIKDIAFEAAMKEGRELLFFEEGLHATVSVEKTGPGDLALLVNGKADASARGDAGTQLMLGHLPMLLHPDPRDVLVIGLGSGMTLGAVELYPVEAIDLVEIEPAVVEANEHFRPFNGNALDDPRVNLLVTDGRNHVRFTDRQYDVIISEPSNPWVAGMANLFTREFFESVRTRLREGGVMGQWLHAYSMSSDDFRTIVATFQTVFPQMTLWEIDMAGDYILLGYPDGLDIGYEQLLSRLSSEDLSGEMKTMNIRDLPSLLARIVLDEKAAAKYAEKGVLHTDGNARLEYSAPRSFVRDEKVALLEDLYQHRSNPTDVLGAFVWEEIPSGLLERLLTLHEARKEVFAGYLFVLEEKGPEAVGRLEAALSLNPKDIEAVDLLHDIYFETGHRYKDADRLEEAIEAYLKSVQIISDFFDGDQEILGRQFDLNVGYSDALIRLGMMYLDANELQAAERAFQESLRGYVEYPESYNNMGAVYDRAGRYDEAVKAYQRALEMKPGYVAAIINLANVRLKQGHFDEAIESYHQAQMLRPDFEMTHYNLGVAYYQQGEWAKAATEWRRALQLKPNFPEARKSLDAVKNKITLE